MERGRRRRAEGGGHPSSLVSTAAVVRSPLLDLLLDLFSSLHVLIQHFLRECRKFTVACETKAHQLRDGKLFDTWLERFGKEALKRRIMPTAVNRYTALCSEKATMTLEVA
jgi:hypothetical protein